MSILEIPYCQGGCLDGNEKDTRDFFTRWSSYQTLVNSLDTYQACQRALQGEIRGNLLDIGNGGVFNYDKTCANSITVVDLVDLAARAAGTSDVQFIVGDACQLPLPDNSFDVTVSQMLLHHLARESVEESFERLEQALAESHRVLKDGGEAIVIESCLPTLVERLERILYPCFRYFLRIIAHPLVYQFQGKQIADLMQKVGFKDVSLEIIPQGRWIIQLGVIWPTALTPVVLYKIKGRKRS